MDKIIVPFEDIRCLGNIIISKSLSDFEGVNSNVTSKEETINGIINSVFELNYYVNMSIIVNAPTSFIPYVDGKEISFPITVVDENNNPLHDVRVEWDVDGDFTGHLITSNNGTATFEYTLATDPVSGVKNYSFSVEFSIPAGDHNPLVTASATIITGCTLTLSRTGYVED